jgi:hypothetical protein
MTRRLCLVLLAVGCTTDKPCQYGAPGIADQEYRNPETGECQAFGSYPCDPACGLACPGDAVPADWGLCSGACDGLDEAACLAAPNCHAAYQDDPTPQPVFWGCWELPPSGPVHGSCANLDAQACSEHDDCTSLYTGPVNQGPDFVPSFESCNPAPSQLCSDLDCGTGALCVVTPNAPTAEQCQPVATAGACTGLTCALPPPGCPAGTTAGIDAGGCYTNYCIPTSACAAPACTSLSTEQACLARADCDPIYNGFDCTCDLHGCTCQSQVYDHCK